jgi:penicillin-binding protein 1A
MHRSRPSRPTCGTWIGYDSRQSLGDKETGARAALPVWMEFMQAAIANKPDEQFPSDNAPKRPPLGVAARAVPTTANHVAKESSDDNDDSDPAPVRAPSPR